MNSELLNKLIADSTETCMGIPQLNPQVLAQQIIGETILAILATDCRDFVYTTYDRDRAAGTISRVVDTVRRHWSAQ